jgi:glycine cleavage system aminomethyltransferase T
VVTSSGFSPTYGHIAAGYVRNEFAMAGDQAEAGGVLVDLFDMPLLRFG